MNVRYRTDTRRVVDLSEPPFTAAPAAGEADAVLAGSPYPYPGPAKWLRLTAALDALEVDPALVPMPPPRPPSLEDVVEWVLRLENVRRVTEGKPPLTPDQAMTEVRSIATARST